MPFQCQGFRGSYFPLLAALAVNVNRSVADTVAFGACYHEATNSHRCATNSTYSSTDKDWFRPDKLAKGIIGREGCTCMETHIGNCSPKHGARGTCRRDEAACPVGTETFADCMYFYNDGATCQCHGENGHDYSSHTMEFKATKYGACSDGSSKKQCVMNSWLCEAGESWVHPDEVQGDGCTCETTRVGACFHQLGSTCAVDKDSCTDLEEFIFPFDAFNRGMECLLCSTSDLTLAAQQEQLTSVDSLSVKVSKVGFGLLIAAACFFGVTTIAFVLCFLLQRRNRTNESLSESKTIERPSISVTPDQHNAGGML